MTPDIKAYLEREGFRRLLLDDYYLERTGEWVTVDQGDMQYEDFGKDNSVIISFSTLNELKRIRGLR